MSLFIGVSIEPGLIALTLIPASAYSIAAWRVSPTTPALDAE